MYAASSHSASCDLRLEVVPAARGSRRHSSRYASVPISPARIAAASIASWKRGGSSRAARVRPSFAVTWAGMSRHQMTVSSATNRAPGRTV